MVLVLPLMLLILRTLFDIGFDSKSNPFEEKGDDVD